MSPPPYATAQGGTVATGGVSVRRSVISFPRAVFEIARKEVLMFVRTKRLYVVGGLYALGFIVLTIAFANALNAFFGDDMDFLFGGETGFRISKANVVMALALFFPLLGAFTFMNVAGLVFTFDAVVRETEDRSLFLILSKPVSREAFVLGKFAGAAFMIGAMFFTVATVAYFIAILVVGEMPTIGDMGRYFLSLGLVFLGILALASMGLLSSAVCRTTVMSILLALLVWLVVLNILSNSGLLYAALSGELRADPWYITATKYINPYSSSAPASLIMVNGGGMERAGAGTLSLPFFDFNMDPLIMAFSLLAFMGVCLAATVLVVQRRNFE